MFEITAELQDLRHLDWAKSRRSSGTAGSFLKSYDDTGSIKRYYKLSDYDPVKGIVGHECVNEIVVERLADILGIEHLYYSLVHALVTIDGKEHETWLCESDDFKRKDEAKISLEDYYQINRFDGESPLSFSIRQGWEDRIYGMLTLDYLVLNRDRHGANIEVLRNAKEKSVRLAPLFDHGLSLCCRCHNEAELADFDVMEDRKVQSFIGSSSTLDNLGLVPQEYIARIPGPEERFRNTIMAGIDDILGKAYSDKIWSMIWERWCYLDSIRDQ